MIYLEMYGRCGNQMFRYAAARAMQLKYYPNELMVINFQQIEKAHAVDPTFVNILDDFNVVKYETYKKKGNPLLNETCYIQKIVGGLYYIGLKKFSPEQMNEQYSYQKRWGKVLNWLGLYWFRTGYITPYKSNMRNKFLSGAFESPQYFDEFKEIIKKELSPVHAPIEKNSELYRIINNTNSVCLSVRRGDFASADPQYKTVHDLHYVCNISYFERAIRKAKELIHDPTFIVFSDDINWARDNVFTGGTTYYENGSDPVWEKIRLMSMCRHFILSNSTFCWWAQYLSESNDKIVICPDRWFNNDYQSPLIDDSWIKIPVGNLKEK